MTYHFVIATREEETESETVVVNYGCGEYVNGEVHTKSYGMEVSFELIYLQYISRKPHT